MVRELDARRGPVKMRQLGVEDMASEIRKMREQEMP